MASDLVHVEIDHGARVPWYFATTYRVWQHIFGSCEDFEVICSLPWWEVYALSRCDDAHSAGSCESVSGLSNAVFSSTPYTSRSPSPQLPSEVTEEDHPVIYLDIHGKVRKRKRRRKGAVNVTKAPPRRGNFVRIFPDSFRQSMDSENSSPPFHPNLAEWSATPPSIRPDSLSLPPSVRVGDDSTSSHVRSVGYGETERSIIITHRTAAPSPSSPPGVDESVGLHSETPPSYASALSGTPPLLSSSPHMSRGNSVAMRGSAGGLNDEGIHVVGGASGAVDDSCIQVSSFSDAPSEGRPIPQSPALGEAQCLAHLSHPAAHLHHLPPSSRRTPEHSFSPPSRGAPTSGGLDDEDASVLVYSHREFPGPSSCTRSGKRVRISAPRPDVRRLSVEHAMTVCHSVVKTVRDSVALQAKAEEEAQMKAGGAPLWR